MATGPRFETRCLVRVIWLVVCIANHSALADLIYGSASVGGGSLWQINTNTLVASQLASGIGVTPNALATNSDHGRLYFGDNAGTTLWRHDLGGSTTQIYDLAPHFSGLTNPTMADGGSFFGGNYYFTVQSSLPGGNSGSVPVLYEVTFDAVGQSVTGVNQYAINTPGGVPLGDLGDFAIDGNGIAHGNSWDPPGGSTQIGGYWTFDVTDPSNSFTLVENTRPLGNNQPTYQLAWDNNRQNLLGVDFFSPLRLDVLDYATNPVGITPGGNITGFTGSSFVDLSSAVQTPEPSAFVLCTSILMGLCQVRRRRVPLPLTPQWSRKSHTGIVGENIS